MGKLATIGSAFLILALVTGEVRPILLVLLIGILCLLIDRGDTVSPAIWIAVPWSIAILPTIFQVLDFRGNVNLFYAESYVVLIMLAFFASYYFGRIVVRPWRHSGSQANLPDPVHDTNPSCCFADAASSLRLGTRVGVVGVIGVALYLTDIYLSGGLFALETVSDRREQFVGRQVGIAGQIASLLSWGCLYSLSVALYYRNILTRTQLAIRFLPAAAFLLYSVGSAGRQAAFQIAVLFLYFTLLGRRFDLARGVKRNSVALLAVVGCLLVYMAIIAVLRNDGAVSASKKEVLAALFAVDINPTLESGLEYLPESVEDAIVEGIFYIGTPVPTLLGFLQADPAVIGPYYGLFSVPYIYRRFEWLGIKPVLTAMEERREFARAQGLMAHGWVTGIASLVLDFGYLPSVVIIMLVGLAAARVRVLVSEDPNVSEVILLGAVNLGLAHSLMFSPVSDTNVLFFLLASVALFFSKRRLRSR